MVSAGKLRLRRRQMTLSLGAIILLLGITVLLIAGGRQPAAHADSPTIFLSTGMTNPGGEVDITGTGWAPARHYNLYVYGQAKCQPNPTCPPPANAKAINSTPIPINGDGTIQEFSFFFINTAASTKYVFTVVADYPTDTPFSASAVEQVVPAGTPTAVGTVSSGPPPSPTAAQPTQAAASPTAQKNTSPGTGTTSGNPPGASSTTTVLIVVVTILLLLMLGVLGVLLRTLPAKRRAVRAEYYGEEYDQRPAFVSPGQTARRSTGGYPPARGQEFPWQGGVASWDDNQRTPRPSRGSSAGNPYSPPPTRGNTPRPPPPRRPTGDEW